MRIARITVLVASIALAGGLGTCVVGCHKRKPAPSIDGLSAALERSAEKALAAPSLADEQILVAARPGQTEAQKAEISGDFAAAGGTAVSSVNAEGQVSIFADVPEVNVAAFKAALRHEPGVMRKGPALPSRLIEVLIETGSGPGTP